MFILPTWVLILGTSIVFLLAIVLGVLLSGVCFAIVACKRLNDSELKAFDSLLGKIAELEDTLWAKKES